MEVIESPVIYFIPIFLIYFSNSNMVKLIRQLNLTWPLSHNFIKYYYIRKYLAWPVILHGVDDDKGTLCKSTAHIAPN